MAKIRDWIDAILASKVTVVAMVILALVYFISRIDSFEELFVTLASCLIAAIAIGFINMRHQTRPIAIGLVARLHHCARRYGGCRYSDVNAPASLRRLADGLCRRPGFDWVYNSRPRDIGTNYVGKERTVVLNPLKQRRISYLPYLRRRRPRRCSQGRQ